jgi:hypothetical protein
MVSQRTLNENRKTAVINIQFLSNTKRKGSRARKAYPLVEQQGQCDWKVVIIGERSRR